MGLNSIPSGGANFPVNTNITRLTGLANGIAGVGNMPIEIGANAGIFGTANGMEFYSNGTQTAAFLWSGQFAYADFSLGTAGKSLRFKTGTGQRTGNATLVDGTVTVTNATVTANTIVLLTRKTAGGTLGAALVYSLSASTSFTITSVDTSGATVTTDTSVVSYLLIETF